MPIKLLKKDSGFMIYPNVKIINSYIQMDVFQVKLKLARVTPIHKQGDTNILSNYQPISSLP